MNEPITTASQIKDLVEKLRSEKIIAFDTEFIRESSFYPKLALIQIATDKESWIVDVLAFESNKELQPLLDVFTDQNILKVVHAAMGDQECLHTNFGIVATPIFDTAAGASLCGYGDSVGLGRLMSDFLNIKMKKGHARTNWAQRPLPPQLLIYAHADVTDLVELANRIFAVLEKNGRKKWALNLSQKFCALDLFDSHPAEIAEKIYNSGKVDAGSYPILFELVTWREELIRRINIPRKWFADDQLLIDIARAKPKNLDQLKAFRAIHKGGISKYHQDVLNIVEKASQKEIKPPKKSKEKPPHTDELQSLELLKCYLAILSEKYQVTSKNLIETRYHLRLIRSKIESVEDLAQKGFLTQDSLELIGEEMASFLMGEKSIGFENHHHGRRITIYQRKAK